MSLLTDLFKDKTRLITADRALPGREREMPVPERHFVLGTPLRPPFPAGFESAVVGMGCFWGAERVFWQAARRLHHRGRLRRRLHAEPDLRRGVLGLDRAHRGGARRLRPGASTSYEEILRLFWENHDPTQGMRQGNDVGTQYRSAIYTHDAAQQAAAERTRDAYAERPARERPRRDHHRDRPGRPVLLRRGVPPAVPGEEPRRLLRPRRHRRELSHRRGGERLSRFFGGGADGAPASMSRGTVGCAADGA